MIGPMGICEVMMRAQLEKRLRELKTEFEEGQTVLSDLDNKMANTKTTLLRISGAIQVLEELLAEGEPEPRKSPVPEGG